MRRCCKWLSVFGGVAWIVLAGSGNANFSFFLVSQTAFPVTSGLNLHVVAQNTAQSDGTLVATWSDQSGFNNDLTQSVSANQPSYYSSATDSRPAIVYPANASASFLGNSGYSFNQRAQSILLIINLRALTRTGYLAQSASTVFDIQTAGVLQSFFSSGTNTTLHMQTGRRVALLFTYGTGNVKFYMDSSTNVQSLTALPAGTLTGLNFGDSSGVVIGAYYEIAAWNRELSSGEASSLLDTWAPAVYGTGLTATSPSRVIFDGDSITEGTGESRARNWTTLLNVNPTWATYDYALSGDTWTNLSARQSATNTYANSTNWLFVHAGTNDISNGDSAATIEGRFQTYMNAAVSAGFSKSHIVAFTLSTANTGAGGTARDDYNTWLRSNYSTYAGFLVDLAADPTLGVTGSTHNTPSIWTDGAHYNDTGYADVATFVRSSIPSLPF